MVWFWGYFSAPSGAGTIDTMTVMKSSVSRPGHRTFYNSLEYNLLQPSETLDTVKNNCFGIFCRLIMTAHLLLRPARSQAEIMTFYGLATCSSTAPGLKWGKNGLWTCSPHARSGKAGAGALPGGLGRPRPRGGGGARRRQVPAVGGDAGNGGRGRNGARQRGVESLRAESPDSSSTGAGTTEPQIVTECSVSRAGHRRIHNYHSISGSSTRWDREVSSEG